MTTGADLRAARDTGGLSLARMAQRTHFTKSYLSMVETGKRPLPADVIAAYEQVLGVPLANAPGDPVRLAHEWNLPLPSRRAQGVGSVIRWQRRWKRASSNCATWTTW